MRIGSGAGVQGRGFHGWDGHSAAAPEQAFPHSGCGGDVCVRRHFPAGPGVLFQHGTDPLRAHHGVPDVHRHKQSHGHRNK